MLLIRSQLLPGLQMRGRSVLVDDQAETSIEGVFAGGDCTGQPWQVNRGWSGSEKSRYQRDQLSGQT